MTDHDTVRTVWTEAQLDDALSELRPHADDGGLGAARSALNDALASGSTGPAVDVAAPARHRRRWPYVAVAAGMAVLATVGLAVTGTFDRTGHGSPVAVNDAAVIMTRAALNTTHLADLRVGPGQYVYVDNRFVSVGGYGGDTAKVAWRTTSRQQTWVPADPAGDWVTNNHQDPHVQWLVGTPKQIATYGRRAMRDMPPAPEGRTVARCGDFFAAYAHHASSCVRPNDWKQPTAALLASLPRDPEKFLRRTDPGGPMTNRAAEREVLQMASILLNSGPIPTDLRSTIYRAVATMPDLEVTERSANLDGRHGTALGISFDTEQSQIIVDPASGEYIGSRSVEVGRDPTLGIPDGTVLYASSFTATVVDRAGATH